jgi:hypothetical protein
MVRSERRMLRRLRQPAEPILYVPHQLVLAVVKEMIRSRDLKLLASRE